MQIENMSNRQLEDLKSQIDVELQDREMRTRIDPNFTNEECLEDAYTHGLTPDEVFPEHFRDMYEDYISQQERKHSMKTTGA